MFLRPASKFKTRRRRPTVSLTSTDELLALISCDTTTIPGDMSALSGILPSGFNRPRRVRGEGRQPTAAREMSVMARSRWHAGGRIKGVAGGGQHRATSDRGRRRDHRRRADPGLAAGIRRTAAHQRGVHRPGPARGDLGRPYPAGRPGAAGPRGRGTGRVRCSVERTGRSEPARPHRRDRGALRGAALGPARSRRATAGRRGRRTAQAGCHLGAVVDPGERQGQHGLPDPGGLGRGRCQAGVGHRRRAALRGAILGQRGSGCRRRAPSRPQCRARPAGPAASPFSRALRCCARPSSSRGNQISRAISTNAAAAGIATRAPTMPSSAAPTSTATTVTRAGTLTALPISFGTST